MQFTSNVHVNNIPSAGGKKISVLECKEGVVFWWVFSLSPSYSLRGSTTHEHSKAKRRERERAWMRKSFLANKTN